MVGGGRRDRSTCRVVRLGPRCLLGTLCGLAVSRGEKIAQRVGDHVRRQPPVGRLVDLNDRSERATSQTRHFLDRKQTVGVRIFSVGDSQFPFQGVLNEPGALHMARRSVADADHMLAHGPMAKLRVERGDAGDACGRDVGQIANAAQRRLRPILLTTLTTIGGLLPLYLGGGAMWEPMAMTIMAGLLFATVLTLGVVPILYSVMFGVSFKGFEY